MLARQPELTYSEYLAYEQASPEKHEFINGQACAMAGGSEDHNLLVESLQLQSIDLAITLADICEDVEL
ncbi:MAG: hypothetical protein SFT94_08390 [Pseudanabaenaceae cyanobacterium bins.68]|nr:hypothetical protein [Pseudanabaenaceae cyanobacterium bins.68]